jgi:DNA repair exonuclease SbcCD ATPase subunit
MNITPGCENSQMVKISIKRFKFYQESEFQTFTFHPDQITLLEGTSNSGKSTILEALYWCLYGSNKKVCPKGSSTTVKNPTIVKVVLDNGVEISRTKPPDTLEVTGFNKEGDILTDEAAQYWIEENFGTKSCFLATSYMRQGRESPLIELKNSERIQLLQELSFGKILDDDKDNDPKYYANKIDTEIKTVKSNLLTTEGKLSGLEDCYKKQSKSCGSYIKLWQDSQEEEPSKNIIKKLESSTEELETTVKRNKKKLVNLRIQWIDYDSYIKEKDKLQDQLANSKDKLNNFPYQLQDLDNHLQWLDITDKKKEQENKVLNLKPEEDVINFLQEYQTKLKDLNKEIVLYNEYIEQKDKLNITDETKIEAEITSIKQRLDSAKQDTIRLENYNHKKKARNNWLNKKGEIEDNITRLEESKKKYEDYFLHPDVSSLLEILTLSDDKDTNKNILAKYYTSKDGFTKITDMLKRKIYDLNIKTTELSCPECKICLTLENGVLIKHHKVTGAEEIIELCEKGLKTIKKIDINLKEYLADKKLPIELEEEEPPIPEELSSVVLLSNTERQKISSRLKELESYKPLRINLLPSVLEKYKLSVVESYLSKERKYKNYLDAVSELADIKIKDTTLDLSKKDCQKYITEFKLLSSKIVEINSSIKKLIPVDKPEEKVQSLEEDINQTEKTIKDNTNLLEAGKRILEVNKLKTSLEEIKKEIKTLTDRHVALDRIKQLIFDTKSLALEETVETINCLLDEISRVMYGNEARIVVSMFKELKSRDYLKSELNVNLIKGYDDEAIAYEFDELSGGEKSRLSLAITLALSTISSTPFLFIDEGMSSMHASLRDLCSKVIKEYSTGKVVINICHTIGIGNFDKVLTIKKEDNI